MPVAWQMPLAFVLHVAKACECERVDQLLSQIGRPVFSSTVYSCILSPLNSTDFQIKVVSLDANVNFRNSPGDENLYIGMKGKAQK